MAQVLVTGPTSGIGFELAHIFAKEKNNLVLVARSVDKLQEMKKQLESEYGISVTLIPKDLSKTNAAQEVFDEIKSRKLQIDVLVNNAGFGLFGAFQKNEWKKEHEMMELNMVALVHLTKLLLSGMMKRKNGKILNIASIAAFQPGPFAAVYYASKSFVLSFSHALAHELEGTGVTVTALCPGPVKTKFAETGNFGNTKLFSGPLTAEAKDVAQYGYNALMTGKKVAVHGRLNRFNIFMQRFLPKEMVINIVKKLHGS